MYLACGHIYYHAGIYFGMQTCIWHAGIYFGMRAFILACGHVFGMCGRIEVGTSNRVSLESLTTGRSPELRGMLPPERTTGH